MKILLKYISLALVLPVLATSCLKDDELIGPDAGGAIENVIEFSNPSFIASLPAHSIPVYSLSYDLDPSAVLELKVNVAGSKPAQSDITVKIALDNSLLTAYNEEVEGAEYVALPSDQYALSTTEVTIKKGERQAIVPINLKPNLFTFDHDYAIGVKIISASSGQVSGNFGSIILNISGKNPYDGFYTYTTSANTSLVPNANKTVKLVTVGANRVKFDPGLLGTYSNEVYYNVNPTTNMITVECPSLGVQEPQDTRSVWDPANKKLTVFWKQGNGGRTFEEVFTYQGPR